MADLNQQFIALIQELSTKFDALLGVLRGVQEGLNEQTKAIDVAAQSQKKEEHATPAFTELRFPRSISTKD